MSKAKYQLPTLASQKNTGEILDLIFKEPNYVSTIQSLDPKILLKLINHIGLEDASELLALISIDQLKEIFEEDLWTQNKPGEIESFDSTQFLRWLEVLFEAGSEFAVQKIEELDFDFFVMALNHEFLALKMNDLITRISKQNQNHRLEESDLIEKALSNTYNWEIDEFIFISKDPQSWDLCLTVLTEIHSHNHSLFVQIAERCQHLSLDFIEEQDGLYNALSTTSTLENDVATDRADSRATKGYISTQDAVAFLALIRISKAKELLTPNTPDPITKSYFETYDRSKTQIKAANTPNPAHEKILHLLVSEGVLTQDSSSLLLQSSISSTTHSSQDVPKKKVLPIQNFLLEIETSNPARYAKILEELNYLSNILIAGASIENRHFRANESVAAALSTCNLGFEIQNSTSNYKDLSFINLFKIGYHKLYNDLCLFVCINILDKILKTQQKSLDSFYKEFQTNIKHQKPWKSRSRLLRINGLMSPDNKILVSYLMDEIPQRPSVLSQANIDFKCMKFFDSILEITQVLELIKKF